MKTLLALVLFLIVAFGVEIGNCADEPPPCECEECLKEVGIPTEEPTEEVPPYDTEVENG